MASLNEPTATIANGASLSGAIKFGNRRLARIDMPAAWTAADLTFQGSVDGTTFSDLYDADGNEYTIQADASRCIIVALNDFIGLPYIKIRSGTSAAAVNQSGTRTITLGLVPL